MATIGLNLRVTTDSKQGGRKYMEDVISVRFEKGRQGEEIEFAFFAVFDGHGGSEAALFARSHLLDEIKKQPGFWSSEDASVMKAIKEGFITTHKLMWKAIGQWPKTASGMPSTSGTTASIAVIRNSKLYLAHVGDSTVVLGVREEDKIADARVLTDVNAVVLTEDHKPESPCERKRIELDGGAVVAKAGVNRVVWNRTKPGHKGPVRRSTPMDRIPFLAVARALGDLWSYNSELDTFVVSPEPDVTCYKLDPTKETCLIIASDGLWNMLHPSAAVSMVMDCERDIKKMDVLEPYTLVPRKPATVLVKEALDRWAYRNMRADNTSVICIMVDPPGKPKCPLLQHSLSHTGANTILFNQKEESNSYPSQYNPISYKEYWQLVDESLRGGAHPRIIFTRPIGCPEDTFWYKDKMYQLVPNKDNPNPIYKGRQRIVQEGLTKTAPAKMNATKRCRPASPLGGMSSDSNKSENKETKQNGLVARHKTGLFDSLTNNSPFRDGIVNGMRTALTPNVKLSHKSQKSESESGSLVEVKTPVKAPTSPGRSLRPRSPRQVGSNLTNNTNTEEVSSEISVKNHIHNDSSLGVAIPKEATIPKSPLKVSPSKLSSPCTGLVSPIWPNSLDVAMELEIAAERPLSFQPITNETPNKVYSAKGQCENTELPHSPSCGTPVKTSTKRKAPSPSPYARVKRTRTPSPRKPIALSLRGRSKSPRTK